LLRSNICRQAGRQARQAGEAGRPGRQARQAGQAGRRDRQARQAGEVVGLVSYGEEEIT